jgi:phosphate acetyltransferase
MRTYYLTPVGLDASLTSVSLGTVRAFERLGLKTGFVKPVADTLQLGKDAERSRHFAEKLFGVQTPEPMHIDHAEKLLSEGKKDLLMEELVTLFQQAAIGNNVTIAEGLAQDSNKPLLSALNNEIARNLQADVILVIAAHHLDTSTIAEQIELAVQQFGGVDKTSFAGYILTKTEPGANAAALHGEISLVSKAVKSGKLPFLGAIPYEHTLSAPRMLDIANHLKSKVLVNGNIHEARVYDIMVASRSVEYIANRLRPGR